MLPDRDRPIEINFNYRRSDYDAIPDPRVERMDSIKEVMKIICYVICFIILALIAVSIFGYLEKIAEEGKECVYLGDFRSLCCDYGIDYSDAFPKCFKEPQITDGEYITETIA